MTGAEHMQTGIHMAVVCAVVVGMGGVEKDEDND